MRSSGRGGAEQRARGGAVLIAALTLVFAAWPRPADADRLDALARASRDPSWRVRLQAASVLAKVKNPDVVPILERLLGDENDAVRGLAAAAMGSLAHVEGVDLSRVRADLVRASRDRAHIVREHARNALAKLRSGDEEPTPRVASHGGGLHIAIGGVGAKAKNVTPELTQRLRELLVREFSHTPGMTVDGQAVTGFLIDSSITALNHRVTQEWLEINCEISVIVGRLPSKAMVMMTSGGATVQQPRGEISRAAAASLEADALEGAVKGAHENLLTYLRAQH
jgi:hypothetical protein